MSDQEVVAHMARVWGSITALCATFVAMAMPYVVGRKVKPADGTTVVFAMPGATCRTLALRMEGGRATSLDDTPVTPTVRLTMNTETLQMSRGMGRTALVLSHQRKLRERSPARCAQTRRAFPTGAHDHTARSAPGPHPEWPADRGCRIPRG